MPDLTMAPSPQGSSPRVIALRIAYDGTRYAGWQIQPELPTVQGEIQRAISILEKRPVKIFGAGRTDAGVHARGQVAHFNTDSFIPTAGYLNGANANLPHDVAVQEAWEAAPDFHARFSARGKHYRYVLWNAPVRHPLETRQAWHMIRPLDLAAMQQAARHLEGRHDFESFRAASCDRENAVRDLHRVEITSEAVSGCGAARVHVDVEGTAFLKHMVRVIVGSLVEVGRGRRPPGWVAEVRDARDRTKAGPTAPSRGLCLMRVFYDPRCPSADTG